MKRVAEATLTPLRRFLLMEMIEAYLPLVGPHLDEFDRLLLTEDFNMVRAMAQTTFEKGIEKGIEKGMEKGMEKGIEKGIEKGEEIGRLQGQRILLLDQLEARFGTLGEVARQRLATLPAEGLRELGRRLLHAGSLAELGLEDESNGTARTPG